MSPTTSISYSAVRWNVACSSSLGMIGGAQNIVTTDGCAAGSRDPRNRPRLGIAPRTGAGRPQRQRHRALPEHGQALHHNFDQVRNSTHDVGYYDFDSIMHYGATGFTRNGLDSMETVPVGIPIGQRNGLSPGDIDGISRAYGFIPTATTIASVPSGLTLTVDGASIVTPKAFDWAPGSTHTVIAPGITGGADPRYVFVRWSDSPDAGHTITAGPGQTVFCAIYQTHHRSPTGWAREPAPSPPRPNPRMATFPTACRCVSPPRPPMERVLSAGLQPVSPASPRPTIASPTPTPSCRWRPRTRIYLGTFTTQPITTDQIEPARTHRHGRRHRVSDTGELRLDAGQFAHLEPHRLTDLRQQHRALRFHRLGQRQRRRHAQRDRRQRILLHGEFLHGNTCSRPLRRAPAASRSPPPRPTATTMREPR